MATLTAFASTADGEIESDNAVYATARAGSSLAANTSNTWLTIGQNLNIVSFCYEAFVSFDTSSIPPTATIDSAVLSLYGDTDSSATDFTIEARLHDWGATLDTADWVAGADLAGKTLLASLSTASFSTGTYNALTSQAAFVSNVTKAGTTRLMLCSSRHGGGSTPVGNEFVLVVSANHANASFHPKLVVGYTEAPSKGRMTLGVG